jgi:hypothetical protein
MKGLTGSILILLLPTALLAQGSSAGSSHLRITHVARSAALGDAVAVEPGNLGSSLFNPATLALKTNTEFLLSHLEWIQDISAEHVSASIPSSFGTFSLSMSSMAIRGIEIRDTPGPPLSTFTARATSTQASFGFLLGTNLALGVGAKFLYDKLYVDEATGFGVDAGLIYLSPLEGLTAGIAVTNVGSMSQFRLERSDLPAQTRFGVAYKLRGEVIDLYFATQIANEYGNLESRLQAGAEIVYHRLLALRLGYQGNYETRRVSAGAGLMYDQFRLDYAYIPFSLDMGDAHIITLRFEF